MQRIKQTGEVFTPRSLVREILSNLPSEIWFDPLKTWLEPSAGDGNFLVEIKARLEQAGHQTPHVLENMLFSVELLDDNHYVLQQRLGYLTEEDGYLVPNPDLSLDNFSIYEIDQLAQDLNDFNPYHGKHVFLADGSEHVLARNEVYAHRNHRCMSALSPGALDFGDLKQSPKLVFSFSDIQDQEALLSAAEELGKTVKDKPHLPPRSLEEKIDNCLIGLAPEYYLLQNGFTKGQTYKDVVGTNFLVPQFNGKIEVKTISTASLEKALTAIECHRGGEYDWCLIFVCDKETLSYKPFAIFNSSGKVVLKWPEVCDLGDWPETDTPDIGGQTIVSKFRETWKVPEFKEEEMQPSRLDIFRRSDDPAPPVVAKEAKVKAPKPKQEKAPRAPAGTKGGGWQVKAEWIGKGMKVRCKTVYDGSFWECDHDALVNAINASLKAKGKTLIGEPGPSEKVYGATSGLREPELWTRVQ